MDVTRTAFGTWNGGRFMHFGQPLEDGHWVKTAQLAYQSGIRTFITADVYGNGAADSLLGSALAGLPRDSYCLVGAVGHDFYSGKRDGSKGFPRFTNPDLRAPGDYASYLRMATEKSLERCGASKFDLLLLHNPDSIGYSSDRVWSAMQKLVDAGLTDRLGVAPGPANGFKLDLIQCFERFGALIDWAMIILNPLEPWPGSLALPAAVMWRWGMAVAGSSPSGSAFAPWSLPPAPRLPRSGRRLQVLATTPWMQTGRTAELRLLVVAVRMHPSGGEW